MIQLVGKNLLAEIIADNNDANFFFYSFILELNHGVFINIKLQ